MSKCKTAELALVSNERPPQERPSSTNSLPPPSLQGMMKVIFDYWSPSPAKVDLVETAMGRQAVPMKLPEKPRGSPRNRIAFERGQAIREEIRAQLERQPSIEKSPEAKQIQPLLSRRLSERTIQWHTQQIRKEHRA